MKIHNLMRFPENYDYAYGRVTDLDPEYDLKRLGDVDEIWYYYAEGDYEGTGQLLARKGNLYCLKDLGHCSCYGPLDGFIFKGRNFDELETYRKGNYGGYEEVKCLFDEARNSCVQNKKWEWSKSVGF